MSNHHNNGQLPERTAGPLKHLLVRPIFIFLSCAGWLSIATAQPFWPPSRPVVPPLIGATYSNDANRDRIDDELAEQAQQALIAASAAVAPEEISRHAARLNELVEVELIFDEPVNQRQLDTFLSQGGEISYLYKAVSYGWNGWLPLKNVIATPALLGDSLRLLQRTRPARLHLDSATRNGRVRPIWASGFGGNASGFDGSSNITIAIVDSGVDESHTDLNGRRVYWNDFSADNAPNPVDLGQHGSHVAGIAVGSGAAGGGAGNFFMSDENSLAGVPNGSFYPSLFDLPAASITCIITARWNGGGSTTLHLTSHAKGSSGGFSSHGSTNGTSPLTLVVTVTGDPSRAYTAALLSSGTTSDYVVTTQISNYPASGDGFNRFRGVAPGCSWAGAKVFDNDGNGSTTQIGAALDELVSTRVQNNIKVMNLSLGFIGNPGIATSIRQKVNTAVNNGIVAVNSAGNDGAAQSPGGREIDDPGRAAMTLTVAAANDLNQLTDYSSSGFASPGSVPGQEEDYKPDLMAPGGSSFYTFIAAVDSNSGDGAAFADQRTNDYFNISGTSMASPFAAGCAALVIDALQQSGINWDFNSSQHSRLVKMLLCATASESNAIRENNKNNPTLQRAAGGPNGFPAGKDLFEGYGMINPDAAVEAVSQVYTNGTTSIETLGPGVNDRRVWARTVSLGAGQNLGLNLTVPAGGDFDMYLYSRTPGAYGTPLLLASSTLAGTGVNETISFTPTANTNLVLVIKRVAGSGAFTLNASGPPVPPVVDFRGGPTNGPAPLVVTFTNLTVGATNHTWVFGDGNGSTVANPVHTYTNAGLYTVTLTSIGPGGTNSLTRVNYVTITNAPPPVAAFVCGPTNGVAPLNVAFTNQSLNASSYHWNFGDGNTSTAINPGNTYTNPGTYAVSLTAIGNGGTNILTITNFIVVSTPPPPVASFIANSTSGAAPFSVSFINSSTGALSYSWDFGDGGGSTVANPAHSYNNAGVYSVSLTATGSGGTNTLTRTNYIEVTNGPPIIVAQPQSQGVNVGANAIFTVTATGTPPLFYQWLFHGTNLADATASAYTRTNAQFADAGDYSVLISNFVGSVFSSNATLSVVPMSGVIPITGVPYLENFDSLGASGTGTPFGWYVGTGTGAIADTNVAVGNGSLNSAGNYNFGSTDNPDRALGSLAANALQRNTEARFLNISGLSIDSFTISYAGEQWRVGGNGAVNNDLVLQYSTDGTSFVPLGASFNFNTPVDSGAASALDGNAAPNRVTALGGTYSPAVAITNGQVFFLRWADADNSSADNAMAIDDLSISFNLTNQVLPVVAGFDGAPTNGPAPLTVVFTNSSSGATNYSWDFGDGNITNDENPSNTYSNAGVYTVVLTASGPGGSDTSTRTNYIVVTNPPPPVIADFTAQPTSGVVPLTVYFTNLSSGASSYSWDFGDGDSSSLPNPGHAYTNAGGYSVSLTAVGPGGTNTLSLLSYIVVTNPPPPAVANFVAGPTNGVAPLAVWFTNLSSGAFAYSWDFGDGDGSSLPSPVHTYTNAGGYSVSLTAVGPGGTNTLSLLSYIVVTNPPPAVANFVAGPTNGVAPLAVWFTNLSSGAFAYSWDFGDGNVSTAENPSNVYTNSGTYTIGLTAFGAESTNALTRVSYIVVQTAPPLVLTGALSGIDFILSFESVAGKTYDVEYKGALTDSSWQFLQSVSGDGSTIRITNSPATSGERYFRLKTE